MKALLVVLIPALMAVESGNNPKAVGDKGKAVGVLQIHKSLVDEVNRIVGYKKFSYEDRLDPKKSVEMAELFYKKHGKPSLEYMARQWNGGPDGWKKSSTKKYWKKVKKHLGKGRK